MMKCEVRCCSSHITFLSGAKKEEIEIILRGSFIISETWNTNLKLLITQCCSIITNTACCFAVLSFR